MHGATELTGIAIVAVAATLCGIMMVRYRQPAIIGYILAGVILGPSGLGFVENREYISLLAELGVILLLYFIGMELSLRSFRVIWRLALFATLAQIGGSTLAVLVLSKFFGWPVGHAVLFAFCLALSSTAVAVKVLEGIGELRTRVGRITIGVLIAQDLAVAPMLVIVTNMAGDGFDLSVLAEVALSIGILVALILYMTRRRKINLPFHQWLDNTADLAPLAALTWCFALASFAGLIGLSPAFGAFLAGLIAGNSAQRRLVHDNAGPIQSVLLMVFFLSIGLLIDFGFLFNNIGTVLALWLFVTVFKTVMNASILHLQGEKWIRAFTVSLVLGQLGEFSFVLGAAARDADVIGQEIYKLIVVVTVLTLITSPIYTDAARRLAQRRDMSDSFRKTLKILYWQEWAVTREASLVIYNALLRATGWLRSGSESLHQRSSRKVNALKSKRRKTPPQKPQDD